MSTVSLDIRRAGPKDATQIAEAHDAAWRNAYSGLVPYGALSRMIHRRGPRWWANAIRRSTIILVAEVGEAIAGYATLGPNRVRTLPFAGEMYELYLRPEYQGVGLGTNLFLDARTELKRRRLSGCVVWVLADNEPAVRFYENAGGRAVAEGNEWFDGTRLAKIAYAWD